MADSYHGPVKIRGDDGVLLTTGRATLAEGPEHGTWTGTVETLRGTAVAGKALVVRIEIPGNGVGRGQLTPAGQNGEKAVSRVTGLGPKPF